MNKLLSKENICFGGLQWFYWSGFCMFFPFLVLYLKSKNYSEINIGVIMSVISLASIIGQLFWGAACDLRKTTKGVIILCLMIAGFAGLLVPIFYISYIIICVISFIVSFTENSMAPIIDSWTMKVKDKKPFINYGVTRGMGSLGYAIVAVVFGKVFDIYGMNLMFYFHMAFLMIAVTFCISIDERFLKEDKRDTASEPSKYSAKNLFKNYKFVSFLVLSTVLFMGVRASFTFFPVLLKQLGGTNKDLGLSLSIMALSEVPVLFFSSRLLSKMKDTTLILISMVFFVVRNFLYIIVNSITGLVWMQTMQSLSFAIFLPAALYYINRVAPEGLKTTAQTVATSAYFGIGGILGSFIGGIIIDKYGIYALFQIGTVIMLIATITFALLLFRSRNVPVIISDRRLGGETNC